jgi:predicted alpha/beta-hydrolase family hydrolase
MTSAMRSAAAAGASNSTAVAATAAHQRNHDENEQAMSSSPACLSDDTLMSIGHKRLCAAEPERRMHRQSRRRVGCLADLILRRANDPAMSSFETKSLRIVDGAIDVSALLQAPPAVRACYVLAHGAGAGMTHPFMAAVAAGLFARDIATLRYQFPSMEAGKKRPDPPALAQATVRAAVAAAARELPRLPLVAGGKSFGGRMTSQAQAAAPLPGVRGLVFLGFPLHPAGRPSRERAQHLAAIDVPMLFLQGTRDELAHLAELEPVVAALGKRATLRLYEDADHSFHVPRRSGRADAQVLDEMLDALSAWVDNAIRELDGP